MFTKSWSLASQKLCGKLDNSAMSVPEHLTQDPYTGRSRHRSTCARAACTIPETNRTHGARPGSALLSGSSMCLDVLPCGGRPHSCLRVAANRAAIQLGALAKEKARRLRLTLAHRTNQPTTAGHLDAKRPMRSKLEVNILTLQSRGAQHGECTMR